MNIPGPPLVPIVTLLTTRFWPDNYGGVERHMWHVAHALAQFGYSVRVVTENRTAAPERETIANGLIAIHRLPPMDCGWAWRWMECVRVRWWSAAIRAHAPAGAVWASDPMSALGAVLSGRHQDLIFNPAACVAGMNAVGRAHAFATTMRLPRRLEWIDRLAFALAPRVVVSSRNLRRQFETAYGSRRGVRVVPLGVELDVQPGQRAVARQRWRLAGDAFVVGYVGRLDPCKDLGFLFDAFASADLPPSARLLIVGDGTDKQRLSAIATERRIADRIVWAGKLDDPAPAYAAMDVAVLPSVYEAFGSVVFEAMAAGVPVIGRRRQAKGPRPVLVASEELIEHRQTGLLVDAHDPGHLAGELTRMSKSPLLVHAMGHQGRQRCQQRTWGATAQAYLEILGQTSRTLAKAA